MKYVERIAIALFSTIGLGAAMWVVVIAVTRLFDSNGWTRLTASDWAAWVGAIGTVGALVGAIWIATEERRQRLRSEHDLASIVAARVFLTIARLQSALKMLERDLSAHQNNGATINFQAYADMLEALGRLQTDDLLRLAALPNRVAAKLASADGVVDHILQGLRRLEGLDADDDLHATYVARLLTHVKFAHESFWLGTAECKKAVRVENITP